MVCKNTIDRKALCFFIPGHHKCRERWPHLDYERAYNLLLDAALLVIPLIALTATYVMISRTLWRGIKAEARYSNNDGEFASIFCTIKISSSLWLLNRIEAPSICNSFYGCELLWVYDDTK